MRPTRIILLPLLLAACAELTSVPTVDGAPEATHALPDGAVVDAAVEDAATRADITARVDAMEQPDAMRAEAAADVVLLDAAPTDAAPTDATTTDVGGPSAEFRAIFDGLLGPQCGECHGARSASTNLLMSDPVTAYENLVNRHVMCRSGDSTSGARYRVLPFDADASVLPAPYELCGMRHTFNAGIVPEPYAARIRTWIAAGAR